MIKLRCNDYGFECDFEAGVMKIMLWNNLCNMVMMNMEWTIEKKP